MGVGNWSKKDARSWEVGIAVWREDKTGLQPLLRYVYMQTQSGLSGLPHGRETYQGTRQGKLTETECPRSRKS